MKNHREENAEHGKRRPRNILSGLLIGDIAAALHDECSQQRHVVLVLQRRARQIDRIEALLQRRDELLVAGDAGGCRIAPIAVVRVIAKKRCRLGERAKNSSSVCTCNAAICSRGEL